MRRRYGLILVVLLLAGCSSMPAAVPSRPWRSVSSSAAATVATTSDMGFLRPTTEQAQAQAAAFIAIDPRMDNVDRYLTRSIDQCSDIREKGLTGAALTAKGHARFEGGSMPDLTDAQVEQINAAISVWCTPATAATVAPATTTTEEEEEEEEEDATNALWFWSTLRQ